MKDLTDLKNKLKENGSTGLDMSPGNPTEMEAYNAICELEQEIESLKKQLAQKPRTLIAY